jgi:hypothetical protein
MLVAGIVFGFHQLCDGNNEAGAGGRNPSECHVAMVCVVVPAHRTVEPGAARRDSAAFRTL